MQNLIQRITEYGKKYRTIDGMTMEDTHFMGFRKMKVVSDFKELEELQVIYTLDSAEDLKTIVPENLKKLIISGDLVTKEGKSIISSLKSKGVKIEIVGPVI